MRMDQRNPLTAKEIINSYPEEELADIFINTVKSIVQDR